MKNILVPTDFSANADLALDYAAEVAQKAQAKVIIVHCSILYDDRFTSYQTIVKEHNESQTKEFNDKLINAKNRTGFSGIEVITRFYETDNTSEGILQAAKEYHADIIIMGSYGDSGLRRKVFGSKTATVINESEIPVLTIPPSGINLPLKKMVLAIDDSFHIIDPLKPAFDLAKIFHAELSVIVFTKEKSEAYDFVTHSRNLSNIQERFKRIYKDIPVNVQHLVGPNFDDSIKEFISEHHINLLAMVTHRRSFFQSIFDSSLTQKMSYHSTVPLLSLHMSEQQKAAV